MSDTAPQWKAVKVPKMLYLPILQGTEFKDTGMRIEPEDDIELLPGSNRIRVNGCEHTMVISCDKLRIDDKGFIKLDAPARPKPLSRGGPDSAYVGARGHAQSQASRGAGRDSAAKWSQDDRGQMSRPIFAPRPRYEEEPYYNAADHAAFNSAVHQQFGKPNSDTEKWADKNASAAFNEIPEGAEWKVVTLRNGRNARALFDKHTGIQVSAPQRDYDGGGMDPEDYRKLLEQQSATVFTHEKAPDPHDPSTWKMPLATSPILPMPEDDLAYRPRQRALNAPPPGFHKRQAEQERREAPREQQQAPGLSAGTIPSGVQHLDNLVGGYPKGHITHIYGDEGCINRILAMSGCSSCPDIPSAFGAMAMLKPDKARIVAITLPDVLDDATKLALAEELPVLVEHLKTSGVAVIISTPDWGNDTPSLLKYMARTRLHVTPNDRDERFVTIMVTKSTPPKADEESLTFPLPPEQP